MFNTILSSRTQCTLITTLAILTLACAFGIGVSAQSPETRSPDDTVVFAHADDAYHALAEEIADTESLPLYSTMQAALASDPHHILWVVAPEHLSEDVFAQLGDELVDHGPVSLGLISGSTVDHARALWLRAPGDSSIAAACVPREETVETYADGELVRREQLSMTSLQSALSIVDAFSYQGHASRRGWHFTDEEILTTAHLPDLAPAVICADACQTFKLWGDDSIALAMVDRGAAAYAGFLHSPQGYQIGEPKGFPAMLTWPGFTVGDLIQVQNRGLTQGHMGYPYLFMLGDPRLSFSDGPPYAVALDSIDGTERTFVLSNTPSGIVPVVIAGGALYDYVQVQDGGVAWHGDPFYDGDIQMTDIGEDRYLLIDSPGGELTIQLQRTTPWATRLAEPLVDALDHTTIIHHIQGSIVPSLLLNLPLWLFIAWRVWRRRVPFRDQFLPALCVGLALTLLRALYAWLRAPHLTRMFESYLRTQDLACNVEPLVLLGMFALTTGGAWLWLNAHRWWAKAMALSIATLPTPFVAVFWLGTNALLNLLAQQRYGGPPLYGYAVGLMASFVVLLEATAVAILLSIAKRTRS